MKNRTDVARIHYPSYTDSIKPSLWFSCNFVVINASNGSLCFQIFILHNSRCQVLCGSCKKLPRTSLEAWGMLHVFIIPHVQTQSNRVCETLVILFWLMLPRDHFVSRFLETITISKCKLTCARKLWARYVYHAKLFSCDIRGRS
jgi:hypothetical protein